jgi:putative DNA primase/helicase
MANNAGLGDVWDRINNGYVEMTPSGGIHWLYRIEGIVPGNTKLARRPGENGNIDVLAETRGEGGFVIVAPSNGTCHPSGGAWKMLVGGANSIPTLTARLSATNCINYLKPSTQFPRSSLLQKNLRQKVST